ncbi:site-specific integrase [Rahnella sp. ChDrAdgB13]|uniref:site-specific integrase n=1 Tax=Rahnella sp. ChDrAdgB13 TaxID=1850581 RepID=UPI001AD87C59|nr:site-specific integrase [Rahnella sp. ChDrAdgB13]
MAYYSIEKRETASGDLRYRCTVGVKESGKYLHRERKTFTKQSLAKAWGVARVADIEQNGYEKIKTSQSITLGELIEKYIAHPHIKVGRSSGDVFKILKRCEIVNIPVDALTSSSYIDHCTYRLRTVQPSTAVHDINCIASVLNAAKPLFNIDVDIDAFKSAKTMMSLMNMTGVANARNRRPTKEEITLILKGLKLRTETSYQKTPFAEIFEFSILSCMRIGEVTRILWSDVDEVQKAVLVRDRKDPRKKEGNHMIVPLLGNAWEILKKQPKIDDRVFPFRDRSITQTFRAVRDELGISDLRYHDLRREGASRLFEAGFSLEEVAQVTGHRSLDVLWRVYREIYPQSLHDKFESLKLKSSVDQLKI